MQCLFHKRKINPRKTPPKIKKFIWTSFSEQFPLVSWLVSQGRRQKFARTFRTFSCKRGVLFWYLGIWVGFCQKSLGVHKILVRKIWFYLPPPKRAQNEEKLYKSVENPQNWHFFRGGGEGNAILWTKRFFWTSGRFWIWASILWPQQREHPFVRYLCAHPPAPSGSPCWLSLFCSASKRTSKGVAATQRGNRSAGKLRQRETHTHTDRERQTYWWWKDTDVTYIYIYRYIWRTSQKHHHFALFFGALKTGRK